eukprot:gene10583-7351_t
MPVLPLYYEYNLLYKQSTAFAPQAHHSSGIGYEKEEATTINSSKTEK